MIRTENINENKNISRRKINKAEIKNRCNRVQKIKTERVDQALKDIQCRSQILILEHE